MSQDIHTHLEKLKTELNKLEPAVKHLQKADENATVLIASLSSIHKEFSKHLQNIEKSLADANEKHQKQLTKEVQEAVNKLNDLGAKITKSFKDVEKDVKDLLDEYKFLASNTEKLVTKIDKVDFPNRLDKLDATVSAINQGLQNTQTRIGDSERNIKDDLQAKTKDVNLKIDSAENSLKQTIEVSEKKVSSLFEKQSKEVKILKVLLFISIGLTVVLIIWEMLKGI